MAFREELQDLGFAEIDNACIAGNGKHLRLADEDAGRQMHDVADFWWRLKGVRVLGIAHQLLPEGAAGGQGEKAERCGEMQKGRKADHAAS